MDFPPSKYGGENKYLIFALSHLVHRSAAKPKAVPTVKDGHTG